MDSHCVSALLLRRLFTSFTPENWQFSLSVISSISSKVGLSEHGETNENSSLKREGVKESRVNDISVTLCTYLVVAILSLRDFSLLSESHLNMNGIMFWGGKIWLLHSTDELNLHRKSIYHWDSWREMRWLWLCLYEKKNPTSLRNYCIHCSDPTHRFHKSMSQKEDLKYSETEIKLTGKITREETGNKHQSPASCQWQSTA